MASIIIRVIENFTLINEHFMRFCSENEAVIFLSLLSAQIGNGLRGVIVMIINVIISIKWNRNIIFRCFMSDAMCSVNISYNFLAKITILVQVNPVIPQVVRINVTVFYHTNCFYKPND